MNGKGSISLSEEGSADLIQALVAAQAEFGAVLKGKTARAGKYSYDYADLPAVLEAVRGPLTNHGLSLPIQAVQEPQSSQTCDACSGNRMPQGYWIMETRIFHTSGQWIAFRLPLGVDPMRDGPQAFGSMLTYTRRYAILSALGLAPADDDGQHAQRQHEQRSKGSAPRQSRTPSAPSSSSRGKATAKNDPPPVEAEAFLRRLQHLGIPIEAYEGWRSSEQKRPLFQPSKEGPAPVANPFHLGAAISRLENGENEAVLTWMHAQHGAA